MSLETLFLDAGGVLVHPNWYRVADTLRQHGVAVSAGALWQAERGQRMVARTRKIRGF